MSSALPAPAFRPQASVVVPVLGSHRLLTDVQVRFAQGEHAIAQLTVLTPVSADRGALEVVVANPLIVADRTPVHLVFGSSAADAYDWFGYIASHRVLSSQGVSRVAGVATVPVQYTLTGTSMVMQSARSRSFPTSTASGIARQIAAANQLASYVTPSTRVFAAKTQAGVSDFQFLRELAEQVGYRFWVENGLLFFVDPALSVAPEGSRPPVFRRDLHPGVYDTLTAFDATVGETDPSGAYLTAHTVNTVRGDSGALASATVTPLRVGAGSVSTPAFTRVVRGQLASSYAEAQAVARAAAGNNRYWVHAAATVDGHTGLRPGRAVQVAGDGLTGAHRGLWRVGGATHRVTLDPLMRAHTTYAVDLELGRDQESSLSLRAPRAGAPREPGMVLAGGVWRAASYGGGS